MSLPAVLSAQNPDHVTTIYRAIEHCTLSPVPEVRKPAEDLLTACEEVPGFSDVLLATAAASGAASDARIAAVILLKKLVRARWLQRGGRLRVVTAEEKQRVRDFLLSHLGEPDARVATQLAVLAARIARADWPRQWQELFPALVNAAVDASHPLRQARALLTLQLALKELSSKRVGLDRAAFSRTCGEMLAPLRAAWVALLPALTSANNDVGGLFDAGGGMAAGGGLSTLLLASKALNVILGDGLSSLEHPEVPPLLEGVLGAISATIARLLQQNDSSGRAPTGMLHKLLRRFGKTVWRAQKADPLGFRHFLGPSLAFFYERLLEAAQGSCEYSSTRAYPHDRFTILCALFLADVLSCSAYRKDTLARAAAKAEAGISPGGSSGSGSGGGGGVGKRLITSRGDVTVTAEAAATVAAVLAEAFAPQRAEALLRVCLWRLLPLTDAELAEWAMDAEEFCSLQESMGWWESLRVTGQHLLLALLESPEVGQSIAAPFLARAVAATDALAACDAEAAALVAAASSSGLAPPPTASPLILQLDALYLAAGLGACTLQSAGLDFAGWWRAYLAPGLQRLLAGAAAAAPAAHAGGAAGESVPPVLLRRFLWVLGCFADQLAPGDHAAVAEAASQTLHVNGADAAARLAAIAAIASLTEVWSLDAGTVLAPRLESLTHGVCKLVASLEQLETRQQALGTLSNVFERCATDPPTASATVVNGVAALSTNLPIVWQTSQHQPPALVLCLTLLTHAVNCLGVARNSSGDNNYSGGSSSNGISRSSTEGGPTGLEPAYALAIALVQTALAPPAATQALVAASDAPAELEEPADESFLLGVGLDLWAEVLKHTRSYTPELHEMFARLPAVAAAARGAPAVPTEHLKAEMALLEAYTLVGGAPFLREYGEQVCAALASLAGEVRPRGAVLLTRAAETMLICYPSEAGRMLAGSSVAGALCAACFSDLGAHSGSNGSSSSFGGSSAQHATQRQPDSVIVQYLSLLCRVLLGAPDAFAAALNARPEGGPAALEGFVAQAVCLFDAAGAGSGGPRRRKLWALSLLQLLPLGVVPALQRMDYIVNICVDVLAEASDADDGAGSSGAGGTAVDGASYSRGGDSGGSSLPARLRRLLATDDASDNSDPDEDQSGTNGRGMSDAGGGANGGGEKEQMQQRRRRQPPLLVRRRRQALLADPVVTSDLRPAVAATMDRCREVVGEAAFAEAMASCEPVVLSQLQAAVAEVRSNGT